jgi:polyisoprenoid-binding protein YceI
MLGGLPRAGVGPSCPACGVYERAVQDPLVDRLYHRSVSGALSTEAKEFIMMIRSAAAFVASLLGMSAIAAPVTYNVDPNHTYPSFAADHFGGLSTWRGKFKSTTGKVVLDKEAGTGTVTVTIDAGSVDVGHEKLNEHIKSAEIMDVAKFPTATYQGTLANFKAGAPTEVHGTLTLHGVTKPLNLTINHFKCMQNPMSKKDNCGADASATFNRADFGVSYGQAYGFDMTMTLQIQVEGIKAD